MNRKLAIDAVLVTAGRIGFVGLWFVAVLLIYRGLGSNAEGLAQAGLFAVSIAIVKLVSGCIGDPIDLAIMRRVPPLLQSGSGRAWEVLRAAFGLRLAATLAVAGTAFVAAPLVAEHVIRDEAADAALVRIVAAAILGDLLFRAVLVVLQASERFRHFLLLEGALQIARFGGVALLLAFGLMEIHRVMGLYAASSCAVAVAGLALMPRDLLGSLRAHWHDAVDLLHYLKWMVPAMLLAAFNERLDIFLVNTFEGADAAGLYGAVLTVALVPDILGGCLQTVLQPRIVTLHQRGEFAAWMRQYLAASLPLAAVAIVLAILLGGWFIRLTLGAQYEPAIPAFGWLAAGTLFWLAVTPLPMALVALVAPRRIVLVTAGQLALVLVGGATLLPLLGLVGMAQVVFAMRVVIALTLLLVARRISGAGRPERFDRVTGPEAARP